MGNDQQCGKAIINLDRNTYMAGEMVTGTIYFEITEASFPAEHVFLKIKGKEKVHWREQHGSGKNRRTVHYRGHNLLYSYKIPIYTFNQKVIPKGQYAFPFTFYLYVNLPPSFSNEYGPYGASLFHKVKAEINSLQSGLAKLKHSQIFIVKQQFSPPIQNLPFSQELKSQVVTCCCVKKGEINIRCQIDKQVYMSGETATITVELDNGKNQIDCDKLRIAFRKNLHLILSSRSRMMPRDLSYVETNGQLAKASQQVQIIKLPLQNMIVQGQEKMFDQINLPDPSLVTRMIRNDYEIILTAPLSGCCSTQPTIRIPITILGHPALNYQFPQIQQPSNFSPQVYQPFQAQLSSEFVWSKREADKPTEGLFYYNVQRNPNIDTLNETNQILMPYNRQINDNTIYPEQQQQPYL